MRHYARTGNGCSEMSELADPVLSHDCSDHDEYAELSLAVSTIQLHAGA